MDIRSRSAYLVMTPMLVSPAFGQRPNNPPGAGTPQPMGNMPGHDMSGADMQRMMGAMRADPPEGHTGGTVTKEMRDSLEQCDQLDRQMGHTQCGTAAPAQR